MSFNEKEKKRGITPLFKIYLATSLNVNEALKPNIARWSEKLFNRDAFKRATSQRFIEESFDPMTRRFPKLRVVFEHISTLDAVEDGFLPNGVQGYPHISEAIGDLIDSKFE